MKILLISDYAVLSGGAEIILSQLCDALQKKGHCVRIFSSTARYHAEDPLFSHDRCFGTVKAFRVVLRTMNPWAYFRLKKVLSGFRPDVVHVNLFLTQLSPLILPLLKKYPAIYHAHWLRAVCPAGAKMLPDGSICRAAAGPACYKNRCLLFPAWIFARIQTKLLYRWQSVFDRIVANSRAVASELASGGIGVTDIVHNGVPLQPSSSSRSDVPEIAFAGRLVREKGVETLINAFASVSDKRPDARLVIIGDGPQMPYLKKLAGQSGHGRKIFFTGYLPRHEMEEVLGSAWIQVVPSLCLEACPLAAMESMMRGTALVASDCGGLGEIVGVSGAGRLFPPGDQDALARELVFLIENRQLRSQMAASARQFSMKHFSQDSFVDKMTEIYSRCIEKGPK